MIKCNEIINTALFLKDFTQAHLFFGPTYEVKKKKITHTKKTNQPNTHHKQTNTQKKLQIINKNLKKPKQDPPMAQEKIQIPCQNIESSSVSIQNMSSWTQVTRQAS